MQVGRQKMNVSSKITGSEFDSMVERGAFDAIAPRKIELIRGELRCMTPAGPVCESFWLMPQHVCENQWCYDGGIALDHELRTFFAQLGPGDFFIGYSARVATITGSSITDLREVGP